MRFCQFRLKVVMAVCPDASASSPCPKQGPHQESRIFPPTARKTCAIDSPPSRGSGSSIIRFTPPDPGKITIQHLTDFLAKRKSDGLTAASLRQVIIALKNLMAKGAYWELLDREEPPDEEPPPQDPEESAEAPAPAVAEEGETGDRPE